MPDINKKVSTNIRKFRHAKSWTQEELALKSGLHRAYVGQIERGEKKIGLTNLKKIADAFEINIKVLFD